MVSQSVSLIAKTSTLVQHENHLLNAVQMITTPMQIPPYTTRLLQLVCLSCNGQCFWISRSFTSYHYVTFLDLTKYPGHSFNHQLCQRQMVVPIGTHYNTCNCVFAVFVYELTHKLISNRSRNCQGVNNVKMEICGLNYHPSDPFLFLAF